MIIAATYVAACILFCASFAALNILPNSRRELSHLWTALAQLSASELSDEEKEIFVRKAGNQALAGISKLFLRLLGVAFATAIPVLLAAMAGLADAAQIASFAIRYDVMAATTIAACTLTYLGRRFVTPRSQ